MSTSMEKGARVETMPATMGSGTGIVPLVPAVAIQQPGFITMRLEAVAAEIVGGGTSSVIPLGVQNVELPPGAILISPATHATSCPV